MKKLIVISLGLMMFVGGCGDSGGETTTCTIEDELSKSSFVFTVEDDKVTELYETFEDDLSGESDETIESYKIELDDNVTYYEQYEEMSYKYEEKDKVFNGTLTYNMDDYKAEDLLVDALLSEDGTFTTKSSKTALEDEGYTCTSK